MDHRAREESHYFASARSALAFASGAKLFIKKETLTTLPFRRRDPVIDVSYDVARSKYNEKCRQIRIIFLHFAKDTVCNYTK